MTLEGRVNVADALFAEAAARPDAIAMHEPAPRDRGSERVTREHRYRDLAGDADRIARGLAAIGLAPGARVAVMVRPSFAFFSIMFGCFRAGLVPVLVDPGIGRASLGACLAEVSPAAFIGIPAAQIARIVLGWGRGSIRTTITAGKRYGWGGHTLDEVRARGDASRSSSLHVTRADDTAAILFTSGSTGVPKGAVYTHGIFAAQVGAIRAMYGIVRGEVDLPTFPPFALFDPALGMTTVLPRMDFTRPAAVDPREIVEPIQAFGVTCMFGSPALLDTVSRWAAPRGVKLPTLRRVISAGAPVSPVVMERFARLLAPDAEIVTPYGATEALPVATIGSREVLRDTAEATSNGMGTCVGKPIDGVRVEILRIDDAPIARWNDELREAPGAIGEIAVAGANVTASYFGRASATNAAKIALDDGRVMHRMGDVGYVDAQGRLWFCGRKSQRVITADAVLFTEPCEKIFETHEDVRRAALVGVTTRGVTKPVICIEREKSARRKSEPALRDELLAMATRFAQTRTIRTVLFHDAFPVDVRHNAKIFREKLARWAADRTAKEPA